MLQDDAAGPYLDWAVEQLLRCGCRAWSHACLSDGGDGRLERVRMKFRQQHRAPLDRMAQLYSQRVGLTAPCGVQNTEEAAKLGSQLAFRTCDPSDTRLKNPDGSLIGEAQGLELPPSCPELGRQLVRWP